MLCTDGYRVSCKEGRREGGRVVCGRACMREGVVCGRTEERHCTCIQMSASVPVCPRVHVSVFVCCYSVALGSMVWRFHFQ